MKFSFTEDELRTMSAQFVTLDTENQNILRKEKLEMRFVTGNEVNAVFFGILFRLFDMDKDNGLNFSEFCLFLKGLDLFKKDPMEFHRFVFNSVDLDDNQLLGIEELNLFFDIIGTPMTTEELGQVIKKLTGGTSEFVNFDQVYNAVIKALSTFV